VTVVHADSLEHLPTLATNSVDALVTDPPYGLAFMGRQWDRALPDPRIWREALRVVKPGGHGVIFGAPRLYHRLAVQVEDAGWEIRDCLLWLFGTGFPKSLNGAWGGTALKPAYEPILLVRKPLDGTVARTVETWGTGGINVDGCRIGTAGGTRAVEFPQVPPGMFGIGAVASEAAGGRWPANVVLDEDAAKVLDGDVGTLAPPKPRREGRMGWDRDGIGMGRGGDISGVWPADPGGGPSRFFYTAKASRSEREAGLDGMEAAYVDPTRAEGSAGRAHARSGVKGKRKNQHPTVKPIDLMRWLVRLITPPVGLVLDPFNGSGSTGCACAMEGVRYLGIDLDARHVEVSRRRIAHWQREAVRPPVEDVGTEDVPVLPGQLGLFDG
jgi:DNA modification methylase